MMAFATFTAFFYYKAILRGLFQAL